MIPATSNDANAGTVRHHKIEHESDDFEDVNEEYTVTRSIELRNQAREHTIFEHIDDVSELEVIKEKRYWLFDDDLNKVMSGQPDHIEIASDANVALFLDYKSLFGDHGEASSNDQLLPLAVLLRENEGVDTVYGGLIQPNLEKERQLTLVKFDADFLDEQREVILGELNATKNEHAELIAGEWCDFCPARIACPESQDEKNEIVADVPNMLHKVPDAEMWDQIQFAKKIIADTEEWFKETAMPMIEKGEIEGLKLKKGSTRKKFDAEACGARLVKGMGLSQIMRFCSFSLKKEGIIAFQEARGLKTQKEAKATLEEELKDLYTTSQDKPSITRS